MKNKIKAPFLNLCSRINLLSLNKLIPMNDLEKQSVEKAKVKLYPTLYKKAPIVQAIDNAQAARDAISRASQRVKSRILSEADEYCIDYNKNNIDWACLAHQISSYKELLQQAKGLNVNVNWYYKLYDPMGLKQEIEEEASQERAWAREQNSDYLQTRM